MYKLLIVDDEPLVQVGIKSMINWTDLNIKICGTAINGATALQLIESQSPDIVITDIKMPVMSGLELAKICSERYGTSPPYFIILTSHEDFHMAKEALTYQVTDYLVKLELTPQILQHAMKRVFDKLEHLERQQNKPSSIVYPFFEKFFIRLLNNLFESEEQFLLQSHDLNLDFHYLGYVCCYGEIHSDQADKFPLPKQLALYSSALQMLKELTAKYFPCYVISLDTRHFALIFCYDNSAKPQKGNPYYGQEIHKILNQIGTMIQNYYNATFRCGIGSLVETPESISDSYQYARQTFQTTNTTCKISFYEDTLRTDSYHDSFNISLFRKDLTTAFEEYDADAFQKTITSICELFLSHPDHYVQALDAACNILYLSISLLQNGKNIISDFYQDNPDGYLSIYAQTSVIQIVNWLHSFSEQMYLVLKNRHKDYKNHVVSNVKKYIQAHITERLSLNEVAAVFGISPNYLSQLFGRYNEKGFSEYINTCKINESKKLLADSSLKIYQVSEKLGFESAFYFSKVFKKVEGISPTEYLNKNFG